MKRNWFILMAVAVAMALTTACDKKNEVEDPTDGYDFSLNMKLVQLMVGDKFQLKPVWDPEITESVDYKFSVEDEAVATVSSNGVIEAVALGTTNVRVMAEYDEDIYRATCKVEVMENKAVITINGKEMDGSMCDTIWAGNTLQLVGNLAVNEPITKKEWSISDNTIATISADNGLVTAKSTGKTSVTLKITTAKNQEFTATTYIFVREKLCLKYQLDEQGMQNVPTTPIVAKWGQRLEIIVPEPYTAVWTVDDPSKAWGSNKGVSNVYGNINPVDNAKLITVTAATKDGQEVSCQVKVESAALELSMKSMTLGFGNTQDISCNYEKMGLNVTWESNAYVMVSEPNSYKIRKASALDFSNAYVNSGKAKIVCKYGTQTAECAVTIPFPESFLLDSYYRTCVGGSDYNFNVSSSWTGSDGNYKHKSLNEYIKWVTSNGNLTVTNGVLHAVSTGMCAVYATLGSVKKTCNVDIVPAFKCGDDIYFSFAPSNGYYDKETKTFSLYGNEMFYHNTAGSNNEKISNDSYLGYIDLFGSGCFNNSGSALRTSTDESTYKVNSNSYSKMETISNRPYYVRVDLERLWMPTYAEMDYIINKRPNAASLYFVGRIDLGSSGTPRYRNGLFILPDGVSYSKYSSNFKNEGSGFAQRTIFHTNAKTMVLNDGVVFLPAAGNRKGTSVSGWTEEGWYWLRGNEYNTSKKDARGSCLHFTSSKVEVVDGKTTDLNDNNDLNRGMAIRLGAYVPTITNN